MITEMNAEKIFQKAIPFEEVNRIRKEKHEQQQKRQEKKNRAVVEQIPERINSCRLSGKYFEDYYIYVGQYNPDLQEMLNNMGFKTKTCKRELPCTLVEYNVYVRDDDLYFNHKRKKSKECAIL
jgi:hypothetical protein